jgi:transposase
MRGSTARQTTMFAVSDPGDLIPEQLLKASVLMALYSIRSERQFCERLQYDLLFKWFLGLNVEDATFDATSFSKNRERLLCHLVSRLSSRRCWKRRGSGTCSPTSTSRWTGHCWSPGPL